MFSNGIEIIANSFIGTKTITKQVRFPKSKKKRIRAKWSKRHANFETKIIHEGIVWDNKIFVSPETYNKLLNK